MKKRIDKVNYYLDIAETVSERSTCFKRHYGAIIVNNDSIISSGFNGSPRGVKDCYDIGHCLRQDSPRGIDYSSCVSCHAEQNAIISASREQMIGSTLYLVGINQEDNSYVENSEPCSLCKRMIINSGISQVIVRIKDDYKKFNVDGWKNIDSITGGY